jgi:uncharacterized membrane protein
MNFEVSNNLHQRFRLAPKPLAASLVASVFGGLLALAWVAPLLDDGNGTGILYLLFSSVCHQRPERCFHVDGLPVGICVRCTGIYAGVMIGSLAFAFITVPNRTITKALLLSLVAIAADVALEGLGLYHNFFPSRLVTGFCFGGCVGFFSVKAVQEFLS